MLLIQQFARQVPAGAEGRVVNILDWRATQPVADHFPYTISKAALAALTKAAAQALAPAITVNGLALGAILPPEGRKVSARIMDGVPAARWGELSEVENALMFLLGGPSYLTGEILHLDGGRHLT
jgi:pteridine reductase